MADPNVKFMICISFGVIPSKDTNMDRCKAKIETKASANDMLRKAIIGPEVLRLNLMRLIVASVIFVKA